jgi:hypothetical protein
LVSRQATQGRRIELLLYEPSLWKGPIVPFVFGFAYYVVPIDEAVLAFNAIAFGISAGVFVTAFCRLGANRLLAVVAVLMWVFYLPLRHVFAYYFAEPFLALLVSLTFLAITEAVLRRSTLLAAVGGAFAGLLLLSRAPFLFVVAGTPVLLALHVPGRRFITITAYLLGCLAAFAPWGVRNWVRYHEIIPFTIDGGTVLFQGTYIRGDDDDQFALRRIPEYVAIEQEVRKHPPLEQFRIWRQMAFEQALSDIPAQLRLCLRKALRFWVYLPQHSWIPAWKTGLVALFCLPLAAFGAILGRQTVLVQSCCLWLLGLWAFHAAIHSELRYSFPVLPFAFLLAALGVSGIKKCYLRSSTPLK